MELNERMFNCHCSGVVWTFDPHPGRASYPIFRTDQDFHLEFPAAMLPALIALSKVRGSAKIALPNAMTATSYSAESNYVDSVRIEHDSQIFEGYYLLRRDLASLWWMLKKHAPTTAQDIMDTHRIAVARNHHGNE